MFKERLSRTIAYLIAFLLIVSGGCAVYWLFTLPIVGALFKAVIVVFLIGGLCAVVIEFINWLIVEPYRNHKHIQADVKRETEGPVE